MSKLISRLAGRIVSGDTPESEIMALGCADLEKLPGLMEEEGGEMDDLRRVHETLERLCGDVCSFSRGLSFEQALELCSLPGSAAIVKKLREDRIDMPPLRIHGALALGSSGRKLLVEATRLTEMRSEVKELDGLFVWLPVTLELEVERGSISSHDISPPDGREIEEEIGKAVAEVEAAFSRGLIGFTDPLPENATHHVVVDARSRRILERILA